MTYRAPSILEPPASDSLPEAPILAGMPLGYDGDKPVFFGHYWFKGTPQPLSAKVACVDFSAGLGGSLVAYRWEGEPELRAGGFVSV